jgi:DNA repair exonuclease SbcCD nuclease subunit
MKPYLLVSDLHCHAWSAFAKTDASGINSRLLTILNELERAAVELRKAGGDTIVIAGDIFHERGKLDPEVFNPTHNMFRKLLGWGFTIVAIPGNHDLKGKETTELGNAIQTLGALDGFMVMTKPDLIQTAQGAWLAFVPWCSSYDDLRQKQDELADRIIALKMDPAEVDLIIHAGINGVIMNMPDHGLDATEVASWGFKRVFAGHYHNFKPLNTKVISIGATTHQQWGDIGTQAGFLLVYEDRFEHRASHAPNFIEITNDTDEDDIPLLVDGNYIRIRGMKLTDVEIVKFRTELEKMGALGASFQVARVVASARTGSVATKGLSLDESVDKYIDDQKLPNAALIKSMAADVLTTVRSVTV